jgi:hypothetical protein
MGQVCRPLALYLTVTFIATPASAQALLSRNATVLPPIEYDYPFDGELIIQRGDRAYMEAQCPRTPLPITLGCAFRRAGTAEGKASTYCRVVIANSEILKDSIWTYETILRHEVGHCNGWGKDHVGSRQMGARSAER